LVPERLDRNFLELSGEIDVANARHVGARLDERLGGDGDIVVDARELSFIDVSGCRALVQAARQLPGDRRLRVEHAPSVLVRMLTLCGWRDAPQLVVVPETTRGGIA
jgi:anti-anti-sigma factor